MAKAANTTKTTAVAKAYIDPKALSLDIGPLAMKSFSEQSAAESVIEENKAIVTTKRTDTLMRLTAASVKAALNDKSIKLEDIYSEDKSLSGGLRQKLEVAVGIRIATVNEDGTQRFALAPWTREYIPMPGESKKNTSNLTEFNRKETFRTNFATTFKKAITTAHAIVSKNMKITEDKDKRLLFLEGKAIKEHFNVDKIALDEKRTVEVNGKEVQLAKTPSYTEVSRIGAAVMGKEIKAGSRGKVTDPNKPVSEADILAAVKSLQMSIGKLKGFSDNVANALESLRDAIDTALGDNEGTEAA